MYTKSIYSGLWLYQIYDTDITGYGHTPYEAYKAWVHLNKGYIL